MRIPTLLASVIFACISTIGPIFAQENKATGEALIDQESLMSLVQKLADDSFEGREAGTRGGRAAGNLLESYFEKYDLNPMWKDGAFFQSFGNRRNILGYIAGSDDELRNEFVIIGAHYDHVGYGNKINSFGPIGRIHNGADDNASGSSALIEIMKAVASLEVKPKRTIAFALWDEEEAGLIGSKNWVNEELNDPTRVKMYINLDMVGRMKNNRLNVYGSRTSLGLRQKLTVHNSDAINLKFNWRMRADSDHHPFWVRDIPAIMLHTGLHAQYHRPSDDVELINKEGLLKTTKYAYRLLVAFANDENLKPFRKDSWKENEAKHTEIEKELTNNRTSRLGVNLSNAEEDEGGVNVTSIVFDSPAQKSGLQLGDRIIQFNGQTAKDKSWLIKAVGVSPKNAKMTVMRGDSTEPIELDVELRGEPIRIGVSWREDDANPDTAIVVQVVKHSRAARSGIVLGDRIIGIAGKSFASTNELSERLRELEFPIKLKLEKGGIIREVEIVE